jgi:hypothetical protein
MREDQRKKKVIKAGRDLNRVSRFLFRAVPAHGQAV